MSARSRSSFARACSRLSTPPSIPRPNNGATSNVLSYNGFKSLDVSSSLRQSNINLFLLFCLGFFFPSSPPMYWRFNISNSRSRSVSGVSRASSSIADLPRPRPRPPPRALPLPRLSRPNRVGTPPRPPPLAVPALARALSSAARLVKLSLASSILARCAATSSSLRFIAAAARCSLVKNVGLAASAAFASRRCLAKSSNDGGRLARIGLLRDFSLGKRLRETLSRANTTTTTTVCARLVSLSCVRARSSKGLRAKRSEEKAQSEVWSARRGRYK